MSILGIKLKASIFIAYKDKSNSYISLFKTYCLIL